MHDLLFSLRHRRHVLRFNAAQAIAARLPRWLRRAAIVDAACRATHPDVIGRHAYAGPDGVDYARMMDAVNRR